MDILKGYEETNSLCNFDNNVSINTITKNNQEFDDDFKKDIINNLKKNIAFWYEYWIPQKEILVLHGNEHDLDWMKKELSQLNMVDGLNMKTINSYTNAGGGGLAGINGDTPLFWQIIGSSIPSQELKSVGFQKLTGHLYAHIAQPGFLKSKATKDVKTTDMPAWYIEGQSDYHTVCLLNGDFSNNRDKFLTTAYVPDGYREKIKSFSKEDWYNNLLNDSGFEGVPVTYEYWSGFLIYEYLVNNFGVKNVMNILVDFVETVDFRHSMKNILGINYKDFYKEMSDILYENAKHVVIQ